MLTNSSIKIIQIVPQLPPSINGLGDYALNLARQLRKDCGIETIFVVGDRHWHGASVIEGFIVQQVSADSAEALHLLLSAQANSVVSTSVIPILLHYVGYGYAERGCPTWLIAGLGQWLSSMANSRLVTMFHEVSASGPPWTSAFWLSRHQRKLAAHLVQLSDRCLTSNQGYAEILCKLCPSQQSPITPLPVFSNLGEPAAVPPLAERTRRLVVFGHCNSKLQVYQQCQTTLQQICQTYGIEEICDIGVPTGLGLCAINHVPIVEKGVMEATEVSQILLDAVVGFLNHPPPAYLAKSSVFAAYCAHRLLPVTVAASKVPIDALQSGKHFWSTADQNNQCNQLNLEMGQAIANNAYDWYQTHRLPIQAKIFATYLNAPMS
jgi:hypothetical protein